MIRSFHYSLPLEMSYALLLLSVHKHDSNMLFLDFWVFQSQIHILYLILILWFVLLFILCPGECILVNEYEFIQIRIACCSWNTLFWSLWTSELCTKNWSFKCLGVSCNDECHRTLFCRCTFCWEFSSNHASYSRRMSVPVFIFPAAMLRHGKYTYTLGHVAIDLMYGTMDHICS